MNDGKRKANWAELPPELTSSIIFRLSVIEILENAQKVCRSWRRVCTEDPSMWRKIELPKSENVRDSMRVAICRRVIDLSQGGLLEIYIEDFTSESILAYIADSSSNLKRLGLAHCIFQNLEPLVKLPLLEQLELSHSLVADLDLKAVGRSCPHLKTLKLNRVNYYNVSVCNADALAIAETMRGLRHLQLVGNRMSDAGLNAILDSCPHLEHLDLRRCLNIHLVKYLKKRCLGRIKDLRCPNDSTADYQFDDILSDSDSSEDEAFDETLDEAFDNAFDKAFDAAFDKAFDAALDEAYAEENGVYYSSGSDDSEYGDDDDSYGDDNNHSDMDD